MNLHVELDGDEIVRHQPTRRPLHWLTPRGRRINRGTLSPGAAASLILLMRQRHSDEPITFALGTPHHDAGSTDTPLPTGHRIGARKMKPRSPKTPGLLLAARRRIRTAPFFIVTGGGRETNLV